MLTLGLFGAAGKIGTRIANRLQATSEYRTLYVEVGEAGLTRLHERGVTACPPEQAARQADVVILAVPDNILGRVADSIVPQLKSGAMVICLDPAAPFSGELPERSDISYFVTHPCHPPVVSDETDPEVRKDFFGGIRAKQNVVCGLMQGPESDYLKGEQIVRTIFAPVINTYRVTVEQMAILEPAMSETTILTCMFVIKEAIDEAVRRGVPREAAYAFALGHININIGILFGYLDAEFSDGAKLAVEQAKALIFQPDWKRVFEPDNVRKQVKAITQSRTRQTNSPAMPASGQRGS